MFNALHIISYIFVAPTTKATVFSKLCKVPMALTEASKEGPWGALRTPGTALGSPRNVQVISRDPQELSSNSPGAARNAREPPRDHPGGF